MRMGADEAYTRYYAACALARLGDADGAIDVLEKAARMRHAFTVVRARTEPDFVSLRGNPRFEALVAG